MHTAGAQVRTEGGCYVITGHNKFSPLPRHAGRMMNCCRRKAAIVPLIHSTTTDCSSTGCQPLSQCEFTLTTTLPQAVVELEQRRPLERRMDGPLRLTTNKTTVLVVCFTWKENGRVQKGEALKENEGVRAAPSFHHQK